MYKNNIVCFEIIGTFFHGVQRMPLVVLAFFLDFFLCNYRTSAPQIPSMQTNSYIMKGVGYIIVQEYFIITLEVPELPPKKRSR